MEKILFKLNTKKSKVKALYGLIGTLSHTKLAGLKTTFFSTRGLTWSILPGGSLEWTESNPAILKV